MTEPRVYLPGPLSAGALVDLPDAVFRHLVQVLRLAPGASLRAFDGRGGEYEAVLANVGRRSASLRLGLHLAVERESPLQIWLAQGISKGDRMDYTIQKAVELGVSRIVPLITERCTVRLDAERWARKREHWQGIVAGACEQSGRNRPPALDEAQSLSAWLAGELPAERWVLSPDATGGLPAQAPAGATVALLVGPEGGLSATELKLAAAAGFHGMRLGPRILRTETAGIAAIAILQARWGDLAP